MAKDPTPLEGPVKYDSGKPPVSLLPPAELLELAALFGFGATKYLRDNWRSGEGLPWSRFWDGLMRHSLQFWGGEDYDEESGASHMICVAFGALVLAYYQKHFPEQDDRWKGHQ